MSTPAPQRSPRSPRATSPGARDRLRERYGERAPRRGRRRLLLGAGLAVLLAVVVLVGLRAADQPVRSDVVAYEHAASGGIDLTFQVTMRPGTAARCAVEALDSSRGQVGFVEVEIPPQRTVTTAHEVRIATQGTPVSAQVVACDRT